MPIKSKYYLHAYDLEKKVYKSLKEDEIDIEIGAVKAYSNFYDLLSRFEGWSKEDIKKAGFIDLHTGKKEPISNILKNYLLEIIRLNNTEDAIWLYFSNFVKEKYLAKYIKSWVKNRINPKKFAFNGTLIKIDNDEVVFNY